VLLVVKMGFERIQLVDSLRNRVTTKVRNLVKEASTQVPLFHALLFVALCNLPPVTCAL